MGAAAGTDPSGEPGYALTIVWTQEAGTSWTTLDYTWTQARADIGGSGGAGSSGASGFSGGSGSSSGTGSPSAGGSSGSGPSPSGSGTSRTAAPSTPIGAATPTSNATGVTPIAVIAQAWVDPRAHVARFVLRAAGRAAGFECALVRRGPRQQNGGGPHYAACGAVRVYTHLAAGRYTFYARALGPGGHKPARRSFSIR